MDEQDDEDDAEPRTCTEAPMRFSTDCEPGLVFNHKPTNNRPLYTVDAPHPCTVKSVHQPSLDKFEQLRGIVTTHLQAPARESASHCGK